MSQFGLLMRHIQLLFNLWKADKVFSRRLVEGLRGMKNPPYSDLLKGKSVTELWLAQQLRRVGIVPRPIWIDDASARGYRLTDFEDAFARYAPAEGSNSKKDQ